MPDQGLSTGMGAKDAGPHWASLFTYTTSVNMTGAADLTDAPESGENLVITDIILSTDTQMLFEFVEETSGTVIGAVRLPLDGSVQLTPRTKWELPTIDKKLQGKASAAGNVYITIFYYSASEDEE